MYDQDEIKEFTDKFGTFFEEFKDNGVNSWMFYVIYVLRRTAFVICYNFISEGMLQLGFSICFSFIVCFI